MQFPPRSAWLLACLACSENDLARLELGRDTLALYGTAQTFVPVKVIAASDTGEGHRATFTPRDTSIARASGYFVGCLSEGITTVDVVMEKLASSFVVTCRFARQIEGESYLELERGGAPVSLAARAIFSSGDPVVLHPISASIRDSTVVVMRDGAAVPLSVGRTGMRIDYGGVWIRVFVVVRRTISNDTVTLASSESRIWPLDPGRYTVTVKVKSPRDLNALNMETEGLRCSRDSRDEDTIHCVADEPAEVSFRNTSSGRTARPARAFVRIVQIS